ncbi:hypothetical protein HCH_05133 [Hahella chejuensis KCTC 2396]|uniref:Uncharacterized protein n=1 Tax=Hahella chejuensis (strain KCTC 2396) TaxID=349521 RepID=Q2SC12_HAHCH|nr:hypothetical protein HCH_05133 [Hahella chejuensis KCTC 2396]
MRLIILESFHSEPGMRGQHGNIAAGVTAHGAGNLSHAIQSVHEGLQQFFKIEQGQFFRSHTAIQTQRILIDVDIKGFTMGVGVRQRRLQCSPDALAALPLIFGQLAHLRGDVDLAGGLKKPHRIGVHIPFKMAFRSLLQIRHVVFLRKLCNQFIECRAHSYVPFRLMP